MGGGGGARGREVVCGELGGGGLNISFRGRNVHLRGRFGIDSTLIRHRNRVKSGNRCGINVESMPNRPLRRGGRGGFEGGVWGSCA